MIAVVQRVTSASVVINNISEAKIGKGLLVLLGISSDDTAVDGEWLCKKIAQLRLFSDDEGKMNLDVQDIKGEVLVVSQFTLLASTKKGNRPSFVEAARPELAVPMYEKFVRDMEHLIGRRVSTGVFGADMQVSLTNDGPVTLVIDTKNRK